MTLPTFSDTKTGTGENDMKTKLMLAGLLAGAMVVGVGCKSNDAAMRGEPVESTPTGRDVNRPDTGGSGDEGLAPLGEDSTLEQPTDMEPTREAEPGVHSNEALEPGTGGSGDTDGLDDERLFEDDTGAAEEAPPTQRDEAQQVDPKDDQLYFPE
ncbi:MAG TPA: hypothetical protein VEZ71_00380 [Archangium sp.]|nr:hypothetical protein [Archangium sp.]